MSNTPNIDRIEEMRREERRHAAARIAELEAEVKRVRLEEWGPSAAAARIAELEAELAMSRAANGELIAERLRGESATRITALEAEVKP